MTPHEGNNDRLIPYGYQHIKDGIGIQGVIDRAVEELRPHTRKFDTIVVQGYSGVVIGVPVALALDKPLVIVRKDGESSHGGPVVNAQNLGKRCLFLDDFVSMGLTRGRVEKGIKKHGYYVKVGNDSVKREPLLRGQYLYAVHGDENRLSWFKDTPTR